VTKSNDKTEILPNLFVGDSIAGYEFSKDKNAVVIDVRDIEIGASAIDAEYHYQCLFPEDDKFSHVLSIKNLDKVADLIEKSLKNGKRVIVHCGASLERSPMAIAWFLHRKADMSFRDAYSLVKSKHLTRDITDWLPFGYEEM
jgi:rhodanese-related sulfurtransferase